MDRKRARSASLTRPDSNITMEVADATLAGQSSANSQLNFPIRLSPRRASMSNIGGTTGTGSPAAKRGRKTGNKREKDKYDIPVGHHRDYEGIPVFARVPNDSHYEDRVDLRTFAEDIQASVPQDVREQYNMKPRIRHDQTTLSREFFPDYEGDLKAIDDITKRKLLYGLVLTPKVPSEDTEDDSMELDDRTPVFAGLYGSRPESTIKVEPYTFPYVEIQVGFHKEDTDCPVFGYLTKSAHPGLRFKVREEDERQSTHQFHGMISVNFESIKFFPQFDDNLGESKDRKDNIRNVIRTQLMQMRDGTIEPTPAPASNPAAETDQVSLLEEGIAALTIFEEKSASLRQVLQTSIDLHKEKQAENLSKDELIEQLRSELTQLKDEKTQLTDENAQLKTTLTKANYEIAGLKLALSTLPPAPSPAQIDTQLTLNNRTFVKITTDPNAGLWCEHGLRQTDAEGTLYQDKAVLSEYKHIDIGGTLTDEIVIEGVTYHRISTGEHKGKMVQKVGPESFLSVGGKYYIEWNIRKKVEVGF